MDLERESGDHLSRFTTMYRGGRKRINFAICMVATRSHFTNYTVVLKYNFVDHCARVVENKDIVRVLYNVLLLDRKQIGTY